MKFKVGDVCVVVSKDPSSKKQDGLEVTVTGIRSPNSLVDGSPIYYVDGLLNNVKVIEEYQLRLKRPPFEACDEEFHDWIRKTLKVSA